MHSITSNEQVPKWMRVNLNLSFTNPQVGILHQFSGMALVNSCTTNLNNRSTHHHSLHHPKHLLSIQRIPKRVVILPVHQLNTDRLERVLIQVLLTSDRRKSHL